MTILYFVVYLKVSPNENEQNTNPNNILSNLQENKSNDVPLNGTQ